MCVTMTLIIRQNISQCQCLAVNKSGPAAGDTAVNGGAGGGAGQGERPAPNVVGAFVWGITRNCLTNKRICFIIKAHTNEKVAA